MTDTMHKQSGHSVLIRLVGLVACPLLLAVGVDISAAENGTEVPLDSLGLQLIELRNTPYDRSKIPARRQAERELIDAIYAAAGRDNPLGESPTDNEINRGVQPALRVVAASRPANARRVVLADDPRSKAKVVLHADKQEWLIGEPVVLHYEVRNEGDLPITVSYGGDYRGAGGRALRFKVLAINAQGDIADDPMPSRMHMGGLGGGDVIDRGKSSWDHIALWKSCVILRPGDYTIRVYHDLGWEERLSFADASTHPPIKPHLSPEAEIKLNFRVPNLEEARQVVRRVLDLPEHPNRGLGERAAAYGDMAALTHPVYLPALKEMASEGETRCLTAIRSIQSTEATRTLIELADHKLPAVREEAVRQLLQRLPRLRSRFFMPRWPDENPWKEEFGEPALDVAWRLLDGDRGKQIQGAQILMACGRTEDTARYLKTYDRVLIEYRGDPEEQDRFPAPRQVCGTMRSAGMAMLDRGATPPDQPTTLAGKLLVAEAIKRDAAFRPTGWQSLLEELLEHSIGFVRLVALDCLPREEVERRPQLVRARLFDTKLPVKVRAANLAKQLAQKELGQPLAKVLRGVRDQWLIRSVYDAAIHCGVSRSRLMEICFNNLGKVGTAPDARPYRSDPFFELLIDSLERTGGSGGSQVDWSRTWDVRDHWQALVEANHERLDAGELIPMDHPLVTTALFPKGYHIYRDGRPWPDWKAIEQAEAERRAAMPRYVPKDGKPFFPDDPYGVLGMNFSAGSGWQFLQLAGHAGAAEDLGIEASDQQAIWALARSCQAASFELMKQGGQDIEHVWSDGEERARRLLNEDQIRRVEQTMLRRISFHAFRRDDIREKLKLSKGQKSRIDAAIQRHFQNQGGGRPSLWKLGDQIKEVLTNEQLIMFDKLRGVLDKPATQR